MKLDKNTITNLKLSSNSIQELIMIKMLLLSKLSLDSANKDSACEEIKFKIFEEALSYKNQYLFNYLLKYISEVLIVDNCSAL